MIELYYSLLRLDPFLTSDVNFSFTNGDIQFVIQLIFFYFLNDFYISDFVIFNIN